MGALPPGSIVEEIREAKETLSLSRSNSAKALDRANSNKSSDSMKSADSRDTTERDFDEDYAKGLMDEYG